MVPTSYPGSLIIPSPGANIERTTSGIAIDKKKLTAVVLLLSKPFVDSFDHPILLVI